MPYTEKAKRFFGLCSNRRGRRKARGKCPPMSEAKKLAHEAASMPTRRAKSIGNRYTGKYY